MKKIDDLAQGDIVLTPVQAQIQTTDAVLDAGTLSVPRTVANIVEFPATRVLYFTEGGYLIADRDGDIEVTA